MDAPGSRSAGVERKLITVLACDVDEPAAGDRERDQEEAGRLLAWRLNRVQAEVARHGGLVVEVAGGTVLAVFGVPRTHDDDAERAVRAALACKATFASPPPAGGESVRAAIATGEAAVQTGVTRGLPWRVSGAVVSLAVAVKDAAAPGTVLVTAASLRATERTISYAPARLLPLARQQEPEAVWDALEPRPRQGRAPAPVLGVGLVGREGELAVLLERFTRARSGDGPQLVTLIGPAGIGKSRLLAELGRRVADDAGPVAWRAGRAHPYAGGGTLGALVEVAKAEAGILDSDPADVAEEKLTAAVAGLATDPSAAWLTSQLLPLVGAAAPAEVALREHAERRQEAVAAWRWFIGALAGRRPLVLALEDLHWADHLLLDLLDGLTDPVLTGPVPLLVVATARPELLDRRPDWTSDQASRTTVTLGPLASVDAARLLEALLVQHEVTAPVGSELLARVGGNPLFAEEYARLLRDRRGQAGFPSIPVNVHGVIAARLDALPADERTVLADAAVLGQIGWVGGIAAVGGLDPDDLDAWLRLNRSLGELERREMVRRVPGSRIAGELEVTFRHVLVRDVAYRQLPRAERADRHRRAAAWLEQLPSDRARDRAELLAHHYQQALVHARAAGQPAADLADRARLALRAAGHHAAALSTHATAARFYLQALELWPERDPERPDLELQAGTALSIGEGSGEELLAHARDGFLSAGQRERAAEADMLLAQLAYLHGRGAERVAHVDRALALVADAPPSRSKAIVLQGAMRHLVIADRHAEATAVTREVLAMAVTLGLRDVEASALSVMGSVRVAGGDAGGIDDLQRAAAINQELGLPQLITPLVNLAYALAILGDLRRSSATRAEALKLAERLGSQRFVRWFTFEQLAEQYWAGRWDQAVRTAEALLVDAAAGERHYLECDCHLWRGRVRLARGEAQQARDDAEAALQLARETGDPQNLEPVLCFAAHAMLATGQRDQGAALTEELLASLDERALRPELGVDLAVDLLAYGHRVEELGRVPASPWLDAARAFMTGDPRGAARIYAAIGSRPDEAYARLHAARQLAPGHPAEAGTELAGALAFFREVRANAYLAEAEELTR